ncbi:MAG TPA: hydroxymethylglutaryl-CoA lyase [Trueperaceae bacterium]|nr:hydroxymethylglutaryl-CoA lyase [Trueperaceae bacterium]
MTPPDAHPAGSEQAGAGPALTWVECPRDAWQGLAGTIPVERKRGHLRALLEAGFRHLDLGSFVSPRAVPQLADTEAVLEALPRPHDADFLCIVGNERGLERALATVGVTSVGFPLSVNDTFQRRNLGRPLVDSWPLVASLRATARDGGLSLVVYLSMGFGNPYGEPWRPEDTARAVARLRDQGVDRIALADTVGRADAATVGAVLRAIPDVQALGLHLHARPDRWRPLVAAGLDAGVRWFEGALSGVGGCPFAGDALVGNLPSEQVLAWLAARGRANGIRLDALPRLAADAADIAARYGGAP